MREIISISCFLDHHIISRQDIDYQWWLMVEKRGGSGWWWRWWRWPWWQWQLVVVVVVVMMMWWWWCGDDDDDGGDDDVVMMVVMMMMMMMTKMMMMMTTTMTKIMKMVIILTHLGRVTYTHQYKLTMSVLVRKGAKPVPQPMVTQFYWHIFVPPALHVLTSLVQTWNNFYDERNYINIMLLGSPHYQQTRYWLSMMTYGWKVWW